MNLAPAGARCQEQEEDDVAPVPLGEPDPGGGEAAGGPGVGEQGRAQVQPLQGEGSLREIQLANEMPAPGASGLGNYFACKMIVLILG